MANFFCRRVALAVIAAALWAAIPLHPARAITEMFTSLTVDKERQLGEEFLLQMQQYMPTLEEPFLTSYINRLGQRLVAQLGPQPFKYRFFIINDPSMNAFAVPGGYVFITSGMIRRMDREGELAGVLAHEISHIYARHMSKQLEKAKIANLASIAGALAGIFLGVPGLSEGLMVGSAALGASSMLKYSRDFEREADGLGFKWMLKAGYDPRDMLSVFKKMSKQRWFEGSDMPIYLSTHPDINERLVDLSHQLSMHQEKLPAQGGQSGPDFPYFAIKMEAVCGNPHQLLRRVNQDLARDSKNAPAAYGRALAMARLELGNETVAAFQQALKLAPHNTMIQRDLGIFYFSRNRYPEAEQILEQLSRANPQDDVILYYLGRIYQERRQNDKALPLFEKVHNLNPVFFDVYYNLGTLYGEKGQLGPAHYYLGFHSLKAKDYPTALFHFRKALQNLSAGDSRKAEMQRQVARLEKMRVRVPKN
ncbi:MAG: tetratricopeptide repeat protein [Deltaproteobacteria bacterium]|nr:tetratricopeptide repeat protein [Deltaproteobacteria bacterium]